MNQYRIPRNNPLRFLPLLYFLPAEHFAKFPTLRTLPRCFHELAQSETHIATVQSEQFLNEIMIATADLVFPHFGLRGWLEHYTGYCPAWQLAYAIPAWAKALDDEIAWSLQWLFELPKDYQIPFLDKEYVNETMEKVVRRCITEQNWQPILGTVREMPCHEDFEPWKTNVRIDFLRKWYHTRAKTVSMVSLDQCLENAKDSIHEMVADSSYHPETVESEEFIQQFKARLSGKDLPILELRAEGHTYEDIARKLGYKTHSGVMKRIWAIKDAFVKYEEEQA